jgi:hypothetical protein
MRLHTFAIVAVLALAGHANAQTAGGTSGPAGSSVGATPAPGSTVTSPGSSSGLGPPPSPTIPQINNPSTGTGTTTGSSATSPPTSTAPPVAGVPNTSSPGTIGRGASPSGLPGDDPANPGFPTGPNNTRR